MITYPKAVDENGALHHIEGITQENRYDHTYYCLGCGEEMIPVLCGSSKESHFRHKNENPDCNSETYIHNYAKKRLAERFNTDPTFKISYYVTNDCPKKETCPLYERYQWNECSGTIVHTIDLKEIYDTCQIEGSHDGFKADVLVTNSKNPDTKPLFLEVVVSHFCTPEKIASGNLIIEISVDNEKDADRPIIETNGPLMIRGGLWSPNTNLHGDRNVSPSSAVSFYNFPRVTHRNDLKVLDAFVLLSDGRALSRKSIVPCKNYGEKSFRDSVFELGMFDPGFETKQPQYSLYEFGLAQALLNNKPIRHCGFCSHYQKCTISLTVDRFNPRTRQIDKCRIEYFNKLIPSEKIDRYKVSKDCPRWQLNTTLCNKISSQYRGKLFFIYNE